MKSRNNEGTVWREVRRLNRPAKAKQPVTLVKGTKRRWTRDSKTGYGTVHCWVLLLRHNTSIYKTVEWILQNLLVQKKAVCMSDSCKKPTGVIKIVIILILITTSLSSEYGLRLKRQEKNNLIGLIFCSHPPRDFNGMWEQQVIRGQGGPALRLSFLSFLPVFSIHRSFSCFFCFFFFGWGGPHATNETHTRRPRYRRHCKLCTEWFREWQHV